MSIFKLEKNLVGYVLENLMDDEETQELIEARNDGKEKKDLRFNESNGMLMQENGMYVTNVMELKGSHFERNTVQLRQCILEVQKCIIPFDHFIIGQV